jgi:hypothetical protein
MARWIKIGGSGTPVTAPGGGAVPPTDPTITAVSVIDVTRASDGRPQKRVTVQYTPPGTLGTFTGVSVYLDHPDSSGTLAIADGTQAADGTVAASGTFTPDFIGNFPFDAANPSVVFEVDAPANPEFWRVYMPPSADNTQVPVVQFGLAGASPSFQFLVDVPAGIGVGREFAPIVLSAALSSTPTGWSANPHIAVADSGDQYFEFRVTWGWPTFDQNLQTVGGVNIVLDDGASRKVVGQVWMPSSVQPLVVSVEADALYASAHITVQPSTKSYTVWLVSFNKSGQVNTIVPGLTPSVPFTITRNTGTSGQEYCALVTSDGVHALVTVAAVSGADGTSLVRVTGYFAAPSDPAFGGAEIVALKPDGNYYVIQAGRLTPITNDVSQPASVESWTFYLRSIDINGRRNTIVGGVTPSIVLSVGNASGLLNIAKAASSSFSSEFQITGGVFKVLNLSAATVTTGILQVGGGGSKVSQMKIFDTLGSLIGFIGDDTGGTGYVGAWFKQSRIGGTSPSTAPFQADTSGNLSLVGTLTVTGSISVTSGSITTVSGTASTTVSSGSVVSTDSSLGITGLQGGLLSGQLFASGTFSGVASSMSCSLWSLQFTVSSSQKVEIGAFLAGGAHDGYVKINGTQVLSTRVGTTPATLSDVIAVLQHHGLSN